MPRQSLSAQFPPPDLLPSLEGLTVEDLKWYATALPGQSPTRKADLVSYIAAALRNPEIFRDLWRQLTLGQQQVVAEVVHNGDGRYDGDVMTAKYPAVPAPALSPRYDSSYWRSGKRNSAKPFDLLFYYGMDFGRYIPPDLAPALRALAPPPLEAAMPSQNEPPGIPPKTRWGDEVSERFVTDTERAVFHDLAATLYLVRDGKAGVSGATRLPTLPALRQLRARLLIGDYFPDDYERAEDAIRPLALLVLVQAAKWAAPVGASGSKLELTKSGQALVAGTVGPKDVREAWTRWVKSDLLDELTRIRNIKGQQAKGVRLSKPSERRDKLDEALSAAPVGRWVMFDEFLRYMRAENLLPVIERNADRGLRVGPAYGYYEDDLGYDYRRYWDIIPGSYLRALVWEYAATLGLVEIAYTRPEESPHNFGDFSNLDADYLSRYDGLLALKLTNLGAYVLGLVEPYVAPAPAVATGPPLLRVLPNLDLVVTDARRMLPNDRAFLERIATPRSEDVYRLSRDLLLDALGAGLDLPQVRDFLAARSGQAPDELPQTVRVFFSDVERRLSALREAGRMLILEADDPYLLAELANEPTLRPLVQPGKIGDRAILLVPENQEAAARRQLKKLGYLPGK
jgi:hypothetical protein